MAANTGPNSNTYIIPEVELGDTFNVWRDTTNTQSFKLNKLKVYDGVSSSSIALTLSDGGTLQAQIADNVGKGVTFVQPVVFSSGVTFNGDVTFNAQTFTVNANNVTIDDYNIVLGATGPTANNDNTINAAGGGGLLVNRGTGGETAAWLWRATRVQGLTGVWGSNGHIGLCGASAGLYPNNGGVLPIHGTGVRLNGNADGAHGLQVDLTNGTGVNSVVSLSRYAPAGTTVFAEVLNGTTYGSRPFLNVKDGANRKTIRQVGSGALVVGTPVRYNGTTYVMARGDTPENAEVIGIVSNRFGVDEFELTFIGEIFGNFVGAISDPNATGLVAGKTYYLSPLAEGKITQVMPTAAGQVHKAVLIATGTNSGVVIPFTGGLLTSTITVSTTSSVATRIRQINKFKIGDILTYVPSPNGVTVGYNLTDRNETRNYAHGRYVLAQANSANDARVAGMVIGRDVAIPGANYPSDPNDIVWGEFDILMDGFFDGLSGLVPGTEYWLANNAQGPLTPAGQPANSVSCLESATLSYASSAPTGGSNVSKRLFMATTPTSGFLYSYRGDVNQPVNTTVVTLADSLIRDLRSSVNDDLLIGVHNNSVAGGYPAIRIATRPTSEVGAGSSLGNVGIGNTTWTNFNSASAGNRILSTLDVAGTLRVGDAWSDTAPGRDLIIARDSTDAVADGNTAASSAIIGVEHTTGSFVLGHRVRPNRTTANAYISSTRSGQYNRSALVVGTDSSGGSPALKWRIGSDSAAMNAPVSLADVFSVIGSLTRCRKTTNSDANWALRLESASSNRWIAFNPDTTSGAWGGLAEEGNASIVFSSGTIDTGGLSIMPWNNSSHGLRILANGNVGVGVKTPTVALDVNGLARSSATVEQITDPQHLATKGYVDNRTIGVAQSWQAVTRTSGVSVQNIASYPIMVSAWIARSVSQAASISISGEVSTTQTGTYFTLGQNACFSNTTTSHTQAVNICFIVPSGHWYRINSAPVLTINCFELK